MLCQSKSHGAWSIRSSLDREKHVFFDFFATEKFAISESQFERPPEAQITSKPQHILICVRVFMLFQSKSHDVWLIRSSFNREKHVFRMRSSFNHEKHVFSIFSQPKISRIRDRNFERPLELNLRRKRSIHYFVHACCCYFNWSSMTRCQFEVRLIAKNAFFRFFRNRKSSDFGIAIWTPPDAQNTSKA